MRKGMLLYFLPALLILASLVLVLKSVDMWRAYATASADVIAKKQAAASTKKQARVLTAAEMATAVDIVDALARKKGLELKVRSERSQLFMVVPKEGLEDFDRLISFMDAIGNLPYTDFQYEGVCVGPECGDGMSMQVRLGPDAPAAAQTQAPAQAARGAAR